MNPRFDGSFNINSEWKLLLSTIKMWVFILWLMPRSGINRTFFRVKIFYVQILHALPSLLVSFFSCKINAHPFATAMQPNNGGKGDDGNGNGNDDGSFKSPMFDYILNIAIKVVGQRDKFALYNLQRQNVQQNHMLRMWKWVNMCMQCNASTLLENLQAFTSLTTHLYH